MGSCASVDTASASRLVARTLRLSSLGFSCLVRHPTPVDALLAELDAPRFPRELCEIIAAFYSGVPCAPWLHRLPQNHGREEQKRRDRTVCVVEKDSLESAFVVEPEPRSLSLVWDGVLRRLFWCRRYAREDDKWIFETVVVDLPSRSFASRFVRGVALFAEANRAALWARTPSGGVWPHASEVEGDTYIDDSRHELDRPQASLVTGDGLHVLRSRPDGAESHLSWHVFSGTSPKSRLRISGWTTPAVFGAYAPLAVWQDATEQFLCAASDACDVFLFAKGQPSWRIGSHRRIKLVCKAVVRILKMIFDGDGNLWVHAVADHTRGLYTSRLLRIARPDVEVFQFMREERAQWTVQDAPVGLLLPFPFDVETVLASVEDTLVFARGNSFIGLKVESLLDNCPFLRSG